MRGIAALFIVLNVSSVAFSESSNFVGPIVEDVPEGHVDVGDWKDNKPIAPKILHLSVMSDLESIDQDRLYVGGYIDVKYKLLLFDGARLVHTELVGGTSQGNKGSSSSSSPTGDTIFSSGWVQKDEGSYEALYRFKITAVNFEIPSVMVRVQNQMYQDSAHTSKIRVQAKDLSQNKLFCGVVANQLEVVESSIKALDGYYNLLTLELKSIGGNLEDFKIPNAEEQEFSQGSRFSYESSNAVVLAKIPSNVDVVSFEYLNLSQNKFNSIELKGLLKGNQAEGEDNQYLAPVDSQQMYKYILIVIVIVVLVGVIIWKRSVLFSSFSAIFITYLIYSVFISKSMINVSPDAKVRILPTDSSTVLLTIKVPTRLEVLNHTNNYYKVSVDSKIGWIREDDTTK